MRDWRPENAADAKRASLRSGRPTDELIARPAEFSKVRRGLIAGQGSDGRTMAAVTPRALRAARRSFRR